MDGKGTYWESDGSIFHQGLWEDGVAIRNSDVINEESNTNNKLYNSATLLLQKGEYKKAIEKYDHVIDSDSSYINAYNNRGLCKDHLKDFKGAIEDFTKVIELDPNDTLAFYNRARSYLAINEYQNSLQDNMIVEKQLYGQEEIPKEIPKNIKQMCGLNSGLAALNLKWFEIAIMNFDKAIDENNNFADAFQNRALAKFGLNDLEGAISDAKKALKLGNLQAQDILTIIDNATKKKQDVQDNTEQLENLVEYVESDDFKKYKEELEEIWEIIEEKISGKGKPDGNYKKYYKDDILKEEGTYNNQLREGKWKFYYSNGKLAVECSFKNDQRQGEYLEYHVNGQIATKENFINDKLHGNAKIWHENGDLKADLEFKNGEPQINSE